MKIPNEIQIRSTIMALMKRELINYDIFPKVIPTGKEVTITVKPLGGHAAFAKEKEHLIAIHTTTEGAPATYPNRKNYAEYKMTVSEDGCFHITHTFHKESEYYIRINADDKRIVQLSVYAIEADLVGRYPYMGDMHMHSTRSDGKEHPYTEEAVAAEPLLRFLSKQNTSSQKLTVPMAMYVNLKATKEIGRYMRIALFVNRILDCLPDYTSNGLLVRRSSGLYFGMELNFTI